MTPPNPEASPLYDLLPGHLKRLDVEKGDNTLKTFLSIFEDQLDRIQMSAEGLRDLHDVDRGDERMLPHLANWVGWDLSRASPIPTQRHEIKYAAALYRITGTVPGCMIWVKRFTGWEARIKEFYFNVFFTDDFGNPDVPNDHGSRTVDIDNADQLAAMGTFEDTVRYTYATGTSHEDRYAYNVVGIFVTPPEGEDVATVLRKRRNLLTGLDRFIPVNIRALVILDFENDKHLYQRSIDLLEASSDGATER